MLLAQPTHQNRNNIALTILWKHHFKNKSHFNIINLKYKLRTIIIQDS